MQRTEIIGNLGRDCELRFTPSGQPVASFSVGVTERWNGNDGQKKEETTWYNATLWGKQAETLTPYLLKGKKVWVSGKMAKAKPYQNRDGEWVSNLELTVREVELLSSSGGESHGGSQSGGTPAQDGPPDLIDVPF